MDIKKWFRRLAFQRKIIAISFLASIVPLIMLTFFSIGIIKHFIFERERSNNSDMISSLEQQINLKVSAYEEALTFLTSTQFLIDRLSIENPSNYEQYDLYVHTIVPLFRSIYSQKKSLAKITLYTTINLYNHGDYVKKITPDDITTNFFLNNTTNISYYYDVDTDKIYLYSQLFSARNKDTNIIVFELSPRTIFKDLDSISNDPYTLKILDQTRKELFKYSNEQGRLSAIENLFQKFSPASIENHIEIHNGWSITLARPMYFVYRGVFLLAMVAVVLFIFAFGMLSLSIIGLSKTVVAPIKSLAKQMDSFPQNTVEQKPIYLGNDEIAVLYRSFYRMLKQIETLIDEVYKAEIQQQKVELKALQAQINPHFFYNSLSLIHNKAVMTGNEDISEMAQLLSQFYRLSLNNGKSILKVQKELELTITYATIQQKMHDYSFDVEIDVEEGIHQFEIITLILQPFVENAIFHGIDHIEDSRRGKIVIRGKILQNQLWFEIEDNGPGMSEEQTESILNNYGKHYGIRNVHQRIKLYYGVSNPIHYFSELGKGTSVQLFLPLHLEIK